MRPASQLRKPADIQLNANDSSSNPPGQLRAPEHELLRMIGRGSYGEVWLARSNLGSLRAVKFVFRSRFEDERPFEREIHGIKKFEPISRSHPGFVSILQVGSNEEAGYFYYVMELADDLNESGNPESYSARTLSSELNRHGRKTVRQTIEIGLDVADALAALHEAKLVHRDIKPSNILFINSRPKLGDIGLVADLDATLTFVGTPGFMPREGPGTVSADIYSLGKTLYEAVTRKDRHEFPAYPDPEGFPDFDKYSELNEVLLKACNTDANQRYNSARELARDLQLLLNGESVLRLRRLEKRFASFKRAASIAVLLLGATALLAWPIYRERQMRSEMRREAFGRTRALAGEALNNGDYYRALRLYAETVPEQQTTANANITESLRLNLLRQACPSLVALFSAGSEVNDLDIAPDTNTVAIGAEDGNIFVATLKTGEMRSVQTSGNVRTVRFNKDGSLLLTSHETGGASLWSAADWTAVASFRTNEPLLSAAFSNDERRVALAGLKGVAEVFDIGSGSPLAQYIHTNAIESVSFSPDDKFISTAGRDGKVQIWRREGGDPFRTLQHGSWVYSAEFTPDSKRIITSEYYRLARIWDIEPGREFLANMRHQDGIRSAGLNPQQDTIVTAAYDGLVRLWSAKDGLPRPPLFHQGDRAMKAQFSRDGSLLLTACTDGTVRVYDWKRKSEQRRPSGVYDGELVHAWVSEKAVALRKAATAFQRVAEGTSCFLKDSTNGCDILCFNIAGDLLWTLALTNSASSTIISSTDKELLVAAGGVVRGLSIPKGEEAWRFKVATNNPIFLAPNRANNQILYGFAKRAELWEIKPAPRLLWAAEHTHNIRGASFSDDGRHLVTYEQDAVFNPGHVYVRETATGKPLYAPLRHKDGVLHAVLNQDETLVGTGDEDFSAHIWNLKTGAKVGPLRHSDQVSHVAFSANGLWFATASKDKTARIWDVKTGEPISPPFEHEAQVRRCVFDVNDSQLLTQDQHGEVFAWKLNASAPDWKSLRPFIELTTPEDNRRAAEHWAALQAATRDATHPSK